MPVMGLMYPLLPSHLWIGYHNHGGTEAEGSGSRSLWTGSQAARASGRTSDHRKHRTLVGEGAGQPWLQS